MVVVATHTPCRGGGGLQTISQHRRGCLTGCPILQGARFVTFRGSHHRFMGCLVPQYGGFESFCVSEHRFVGRPIPQCGRFTSFRVSRGAQSRNFGCANNAYIVCHAMFVCYCVSCSNAQNRLTHALRTQKKAPSGIDPSPTFTILGDPHQRGQNQKWLLDGFFH